jgi:phage/plasmid-associated DNA primase
MENTPPNKEQTDEKTSFADMLKELQPQIGWKITVKDDTVKIYRPDGGHFEQITTKQARMEVREHFPHVVPAVINSLTVALLEDSGRLFNDELFLLSRGRGIGFLNGVFDLKTGKMRPYSTSDFILDPLPHRVPFDLDPDIEKYFLGKCAEWVGAETADWFLNVLAYLLFVHPNTEQIWVDFFGLGANGKSVVEELLEKILGDDKCIGCDLAHINRFSSSSFENKWLVIGRDSSSFVSDKAVSFIKAYSGDAKMLVEVKGGSSYDSPTMGKLLVSTNTLIQSTDRTYSWYRRLFPIPFPNTFERNDTFKQELFKKLPKIIRLLLHRSYLYKANHVTLSKCIPAPVQQLIKETRYLNDRVAAFWELEFFRDKDTPEGKIQEVDRDMLGFYNRMTMTEVYEKYCTWHQTFFGEAEKIEPGLKTFGGPYGAFLQSGASQFFEYKKGNAGRYLELIGG